MWVRTWRAQRACERGERLHQAGDLTGATRAFTQALARLGAAALRAPQAARRAHLGLGRALLEREELAQALQAFEAATRCSEEDAEPHYWLSVVLARRGEHAAAERAATRALEFEPGEGRTLTLRARLRHGLGRLPEAQADYAAAHAILVASDPSAAAELVPILGAVLESQGEHAAAGHLYQTQASHAWARAALGRIDVRREAFESAVAHLEAALAAGHDDDVTLYHHGFAAARLGRWEACLASWNRLREHRPDHMLLHRAAQRARYLSGAAGLRAGDADRARVAWEEYAKDPDPEATPPRVLAGIHLWLAARGVSTADPAELERARQHLLAGRKLAPEDGRFPYRLGLVELTRSGPQDAIPFFTQAMALPPTVSLAREALAAVHARAGDWAAAADVLPAAGRGSSSGLWLAECVFHAGRAAQLEALRGDDPRLMAWQAANRLLLARLPEARTALRAVRPGSASKIRPRLAGLWRALGFASAAAGEVAAAAADLAEARALAATPDPTLAECLLLALGRRHGAALDAAIAALRRTPTDGALCHSYALAAFHAASADVPPQGLTLDAAWEHAVAGLAATLHHQPYLDAWRQRAAARYQVRLAAADLHGLRKQLEDLLMRACTIDGGNDRSDPAPRAREALLLREWKAAELAASVGGFPVEGGGTLVCGPVLIRELRLEQAFGTFAAGLPERAAPRNPLEEFVKSLSPRVAGGPRQHLDAAQKRRLMRAFSMLGLAQAWIDAGRPLEALEAARDLRCPQCLGTRAKASPRRDDILRCDAGCAGFDASNPGYAGFADKRSMLAQDALALIVDARFALAESALAAPENRTADALREFSAALVTAARLGQGADAKRRATGALLGRIRALEKARRLDDAVALLQAARPVIDTPELVGKLAEILTDRGVVAGNAKPPRWGAAVDDLQGALDHNPHSFRAVLNLAVALHGMADEQFGAGQRDTSLTTLARERALLEKGLAEHPGRAELEARLREAEATLRTCIVGQAVELAGADRVDEALALLARGQRDFPGDEGLRRTWETTTRLRDYGGIKALELQQRAVSAFNADRKDEAVALLRQAIGVSSRPQRLRAELSSVLVSAAVDRINSARGSPSAEVHAEVKSMFEEAVSLDGANERARESLARLAGQRGSAGRVVARDRELGGRRARELHQQAVRAFTDDRLPEAAELLRQAIAVSSQPQKLRTELATVLFGLAAKRIAACRRFVDAAVVREVMTLLDEAHILDPDNDEVTKARRRFGAHD